jgi:hypothetical protein
MSKPTLIISNNSSTQVINLERRILDKMLYEVDYTGMPW